MSGVSLADLACDINAPFSKHLNAIAAVSSRLEGRDYGVRQAALMALTKIAEKSNPDAIAAVNAYLDDECYDYRQAALRHWAGFQKRATQMPSLLWALDLDGCSPFW